MPVSLDVREFGFEPGSTKDAGAALRDVIEAARRNTGRTRLELPPGDYHVWPETSARRELFVSNTVGTDPRFPTKAIGLLLEDVRDLEVAAQGARLIVHGRQSALAVIDSSRVAIVGLEIDWAVPTVIDVTVMDAGVDAGGAWRLLSLPACTRFRVDGTEVVWLSEESPYTGELYWSGRAALGYSQILDPVSGRVQRAACPLFDDVAHIERVDAQTMLVSSLSASAPDDRGLVYQLRETDRDHPGMLVLDSADVAFQRLRIGYLHGFGLIAQNSADLTLDGVVFRPPEGTGRVTAGFADFVHCSGMRGRVDIRGCEFDGPHDDPINVHGTYLAVATAEANQLELEFRHDQTAGFPQYAPGETIELLHRRTLQPVHTATVEHVTGPTGRDSASASSPMRVGVTGDLPADVLAAATAGELAAENTTRTPEVAIVDCVFRHVPTRAILVTTRRSVRIETCRFDSITMPCIQIAADAADWWESGPVNDVAIIGNTFRDVSAGTLVVAPGIPVGSPAVHGAIVFEANDVELTEPLIAELRGLRSFVARDNVLSWSARAAPGHVLAVVSADPDVRVEWEGVGSDSPAVRRGASQSSTRARIAKAVGVRRG
jgi:hypothetical protein